MRHPIKMKKLFLLFILFGCITVNAQPVLTIDEVLSMAMKNNYDITIAKNEALISQTNNTAGAAGMLPNINVSGSGYYALKTIDTKESQEENFSSVNNGVTSLYANAELTWTIFDGGKMFVTKSKLKQIEILGEIQFKQQVLQTLSDVIAAYFNVVKQKQQLAAINQTINYNLERVKIAETGYNAGSGKKTDLLQAKIDLNVNRQNAINQEASILTAKRELARLLVTENETSFDVSNQVTFSYTPNSDELQQKLYQQNTQVLTYQKNFDIDQLALKESYRSLMPKVNFNAGYYFQNINTAYQSTNITGVVRTIYPQVGGSISIPIYQGGTLQRQVALSRINADLSRYDLENLKLEVNKELLDALTTFENQKKLLEIERENYQLTKENIEICLQRMRLGEATSLEVRIAQSDFEQSATRLTTFEYNLKMAETKLKQMMGEL